MEVHFIKAHVVIIHQILLIANHRMFHCVFTGQPAMSFPDCTTGPVMVWLENRLIDVSGLQVEGESYVSGIKLVVRAGGKEFV